MNKENSDKNIQRADIDGYGLPVKNRILNSHGGREIKQAKSVHCLSCERKG